VVLLSAVVFAGDYALTVWGARLYRNSGAKDILQYEGSCELTPYYQADIESGRWFSRRFVLALLVSAGLLTVLWWITVKMGLWPMLFAVGVGSVLLRKSPSTSGTYRTSRSSATSGNSGWRPVRISSILAR